MLCGDVRINKISIIPAIYIDNNLFGRRKSKQITMHNCNCGLKGCNFVSRLITKVLLGI